MIVVIVRTLNEEHRIREFCSAYSTADKVLIADGGSEDNTILYAQEFPNVEIRNYEKRIQLQNDYWRNPDADHINFLIQWAKEYNPSWIILDDCDCRPNFLLKRDYLRILENTDNDFVMAVRLYLWGKLRHFSYLAKPEEAHKKWEASFWAWRGNINFSAIDVPPAWEFSLNGHHVRDLHEEAKVLDLMPPYCLLHYSWDDPEKVEQKVKYYRESGFIPGQLHPLQYGSPLENLPWWAME